MHELSVCQGLLRQVEAVGRRHAARVCGVVLRVGPLSGVDPDLLARAYPVAAADTEAAGSTLTIETVPLRVRCQSCGAEAAVTLHNFTCTACGDWHTELLSGDELLLVSVELDSPLPLGEVVPQSGAGEGSAPGTAPGVAAPPSPATLRVSASPTGRGERKKEPADV
jgi:hydrogenase nickel incorporation protein HypA/HybF